MKVGAYPVTAKQLVKMLTTTAPIIIPIMNSKKRPLSEAAVTKVVELSSSRVVVETSSCLSFSFPLSQGCLKSEITKVVLALAARILGNLLQTLRISINFFYSLTLALRSSIKLRGELAASATESQEQPSAQLKDRLTKHWSIAICRLRLALAHLTAPSGFCSESQTNSSVATFNPVFYGEIRHISI
ncbi:unnamed protein product [Ixodes pacificus]